MTYEFRSSDLDFALFLADLTPRQVIPERWHEHHPQVRDRYTFAQTIAQVEALVSPELVATSGLAKWARYRGIRGAV